jgi:acyl-CoA thioesterase-1
MRGSRLSCGHHTRRRGHSVAPAAGEHDAYAGPVSRVNRLARPALAAFGLGLALNLAAAPTTHAEPVTLVALGDSLTAGFGLAPEDAFPARLEAALRARGHDVSVVNAGVSGDTSAASLARLDWSLGTGADGVIVELGANDALRGIMPGETQANLESLISSLRDRGIHVLLAGMYAPRNLGADYTAAFDAIYPELAERHELILYPFFLDGVATDPALNQSDGVHPNADGVETIVERILPAVEELLAEIEADDPNAE